MKRAVVLPLPVALVAATLGGCGLFGGSSTLDEALAVVPASATHVVFVDRGAIAERFEVDDVGSDAGAEEIDRYLEAARDFPSTTVLENYLVLMREDSPFTALDVEWEVTGLDRDGTLGRAWKLRDDLDLDRVGDDLVDRGYREEPAEGDARAMSIDLDELGPDDRTYLASMREVTIVPDEHLVISGPLRGEMLQVVNDDEDSAVDSGSFAALVDSTDDVEVASLARGDDACRMPSSQPRLDGGGFDDLGDPEQTGFFVHGDEGDARSVLAFDDEDEAEADAEAREDFLAEGRSPISAVPYSEFGDWEIETDGDQIRIDIDYDEPRTISAVISRGDYLSVCAPS